MKFKLSFLFSTLAFSTAVFAHTPQLSKAELAKFDWQAVNLSQTMTNEVGKNSTFIGYKIPANQGTLKIKVKSLVVDNNHIFVPNLRILDANYNVSLEYPATQFKRSEARGFNENQLEAELSLTPVAGQDFVYLLIYTTEQDLQGKTTFTHPAKLYEKAKGNQPPAIADIIVKHTNTGKVEIEVDGIQSTQFIGLGNIANGGALFESKPVPQAVGEFKTQPVKTAKVENKAAAQPVEQTTEQYFNQAVKQALKNNDINKALNLVNEAEKLGLTSPRQLFLQQVQSK